MTALSSGITRIVNGCKSKGITNDTDINTVVLQYVSGVKSIRKLNVKPKRLCTFYCTLIFIKEIDMSFCKDCGSVIPF